ncbi:class I SAM-dependent methyltransferase [Streptomyces ipomoeae]|uniref:Methyltransferase domain protein n=4 Tax=Streptomyces ipomoeae TaxID=103232 RepID=L1L384_9ACTN|nr:class I SAM-dependent methyltransferase [Streptomyces ipomoeae]EKX67165.1 methyltransferase domain protein [Streptomyces ipomoeae 91-03]MDX2824940.1 class I SAM-dependent methyltransferase [Streptomyces ipomoeae]MDX2877567.1 class I SAM-dependent methyltransferase [Streptomyces ipomoeae]TQE28141.1 class I SAM-dependent methyltransferase [Streptomyces ipomoeae]TQE30332.1 class I SAM-dependent methyltransferase [Streptomyces ipomoeae]
MFSPQGPSLRELVVQALSSVEHGYDLLAPKFDHTPFRTPDTVLDAVEHALSAMGPFEHGLDLCCGTGAGMGVLRDLCEKSVTGVDISAGMLAVGRERLGDTGASGFDASGRGGERGRGPGSDGRGSEVAGPGGPSVAWVRGDARALPFGPVFDLAVSFGAFGHFLPGELPGLFTQVHSVLRPGGRFVFPLPAPAPPRSPWYWAVLGFDTAMRVRNALWRPPFVMYYRPFRLSLVRDELERVGFTVDLFALPEFGHRPDGSPRCRMVVATRSREADRHPR